MYGAILGDIIGSPYEFDMGDKTKDFPLFSEESYFTDDTVMTIAVARALIECNGDFSNLKFLTIKNMKDYGYRYPAAGYGGSFREWLKSYDSEPYNSFGNGSAMRISPVAYFAKSLEEVKELSRIVTEVTHNHPEGIMGAEAVACAIWLALHNSSKEEILQYIEDNYYFLDYDYEKLLETYSFEVSCQESVPQSIYAFLISEDFEDAIKIAVSMGGDADTMACIAGAIAEAYYGVPEVLQKECWEYLTPDIKYVIKKFQNHFKN